MNGVATANCVYHTIQDVAYLLQKLFPSANTFLHFIENYVDDGWWLLNSITDFLFYTLVDAEYSQFIPPKRFQFPGRKCGQRLRRCQMSWWERYPWLHYRTVDDKVFCDTCIRAAKQGMNNDKTISNLANSRPRSVKNFKCLFVKLTLHTKSIHQH